MRKGQSKLYPDFARLLMSAVILAADLAGRPTVPAAAIAIAIRMPIATVRKHLKAMAEVRYVRPSNDGWSPDDAAWFALEMFLPSFRQVLKDLKIG